MTNIIHITSLNCQGLRDKHKRERLKQYMLTQKADIFFIQETHFTHELMPIINNEFIDWKFYNSYGNNKSRGCSILFKKSLNCDITHFILDSKGRYILINIVIDSTPYCLINIYACNDKVSRNSFFESLTNVIEDNSEGMLILGGDFNDTLNLNDRIGKHIAKNKTVKTLNTLINRFTLIDIWRKNNTHSSQYTWKRKNSIEKSRIDFWLIGTNLVPLVSSTDIRPACIQYTDHQAISLKIIKSVDRGPGYWKLNNSYLNDKKYIEIISNTIEKYKTSHYMNPQIKWELLKNEIKEKSIKYAKKTCSMRNNDIYALEAQLAHLYAVESTNSSLKTDIETKLNMLYEAKAKGAEIRSKLEFIEHGEKNNKYFLNIEKSRQAQKSINKFIYGNKTFTSTDDILNEEVRFYTELYTSQNIHDDDIKQYLSNVNSDSKLSPEDAELCEGLFTTEECEFAIKSMKTNKSPGLDGLTIEFYQTFWCSLKDILPNVLNEGFSQTQLTQSQRTGLLSLLYKKGDPTNLENWRPICLLNNDYKIAATILTNRLQKVIHKIISSDQQGYIKDRFIGYNIRQIQDIIDYADKLSLNGAVIFLDFRKAFDTIEHNFLFESLKYFGFKNTFIQWIKTLYGNTNKHISNNGWISRSLQPKRGINQGCPISALLFIITVEIMATKIRKSNNINGFEIKCKNKPNHIKISQLADDTTLFVRSETDILNALQIIDYFGSLSGLQLNKTKTEAIWIGSKKHSTDKVGNILWTDQPIKALGIFFGHDKKQCEKLNWDSKLDSCKKLINTWSKRKLTMYGKILIIKSIIIPKLTYIFHSLIVPNDIVKQIESLLFNFLWNGTKEKIKRTTLIGHKLNGGIEMLDIETYITSIKLKWIKALTDKNDANWKAVPRYFFNIFGPDFLIFHFNSDNNKSLDVSTLPDFYNNILSLWVNAKSKVLQNEPKTFFDIRKEIIWGNRFIKNRGKSLIFKKWIDSNLIFVNDIFTKQGLLREDHIYNKLIDKSNWISEINILKKCIPKTWITTINSHHSKQTTVKTMSCIMFGDVAMKLLKNKHIYDILIKTKFTKPYIHRYWHNHFNDSDIKWKSQYEFINTIRDNRVKQFKYKLIHRIFPCKEIRFKWKLANTQNCFLCNTVESYEHVFIECSTVQMSWTNIHAILRECGIDKNIKSLEYIILGYKISNAKYHMLNQLLTLFGFCIYKAYFLSDSKLIHVDIWNIYKKELSILLHYFDNKGVTDLFLTNFKKAL